MDRRAAEYEEASKIEWFEAWFIPVLERADVRGISWEDLIEKVAEVEPGYGQALQKFYQKCIQFNEWIGRRF